MRVNHSYETKSERKRDGATVLMFSCAQAQEREQKPKIPKLGWPTSGKAHLSSSVFLVVFTGQHQILVKTALGLG